MKWIVGLDLHPSGVGALRFASWLSKTSAAEDEVVGIHVLEQAYLRSALRYHHLDELMNGATKAAHAAIEDAQATAEFSSFHVLQGSTPEKSIAAAHDYHAAQGLILGRQAKKEGRDIFRLGRVARRVLRTLPGPTIVVPPDYGGSSDGPIIASCSMRDDSIASVQFARDMARRMQRPLVIAHVVPTPDDYAAHYLPEASLTKMRADNLRDGTESLTAWAQENDCGGSERVVLQGGIVEQLLALSSERSAAMLVSGSRRLSTFERVLLTSIASELAATAACPVAVVPPA